MPTGSTPVQAHAVLVGINTYKFGRPKNADGWRPLAYAQNDVDSLAQTLREECKWPSGAFQSLLGSRADRKRVSAAFQDALAKSTPNEFVFLYFAGHATVSSNSDLALAAWDTRPDGRDGILSSTLRKWVDESPAGYVLIVLDCCYAGSFGGAPPILSKVWDFGQRSSHHPHGQGRAVIAASWYDELSAEMAFASSGNGIFTHYLIEGLRGGGPEHLSVTRFGEVDAASLVDYVRKQLEGVQHPDFFSRGTFPVLYKRIEWMGDAPMDPVPQPIKSHPGQLPTARRLWQQDFMRGQAKLAAFDLANTGTFVAVALTDGSCHMLKGTDGTRDRVVSGPGDSVQHLLVSPNTQRIALARLDARSGKTKVALYSVKDADSVMLDSLDDQVVRVGFSPGSHFIAAASVAGKILVWDTRSNDLVARLARDEFGAEVRDFAFCSPEGKRLASLISGHPEAFLWDVNMESRESGSSRALKVLSPARPTAGDEAWFLAVAPNDKFVVAVSRKGTVTLWSLPDGSSPSELMQVQGLPATIAISPNSDRLACGTTSKEVWLVPPEGRGGRDVQQFSSRITSVCFSPDPTSNLVCAATSSGEVAVWNYITGNKLELEHPKGHERSLVAGETFTQFSRDGVYLLIGNESAGLLEMWKIEWSKELASPSD